MSLNAAAIAVMVAQGMDAGGILAVAEALEIKKDRTGAERQARYRERNKVTRDVTRDGSDAAPCLDKKSPQTPEKIKPIPCVREPRATPAYHRLPEGWQPSRSAPPELQAKLDEWPPGAFGDELAAFKRWAANAEDKNGKGRKLDWDKALWNWLGRRHDERYSKSRNGNVAGLRGTRPDPALDLLRAARAAENREADRGTRTALPAIGPSGP